MKKVYFKPNEIPFGQDFAMWEGIPEYLIFTVVEDKPFFKNRDDIWLRAPGYGENGSYGNGNIVIRKLDLEKHKSKVYWIE